MKKNRAPTPAFFLVRHRSELLHDSGATPTERKDEVEQLVGQARLRVEETKQLLGRVDKFLRDLEEWHGHRMNDSSTTTEENQSARKHSP